MKEKIEFTPADTSRLRDMAKDTSVLVGNDYRDALNAAADEIDRLRAERDQWRKQALEEDASNEAWRKEAVKDRELLDDTAEALKNALMCILSYHEEDFVDDDDGEQCDFDDGGNFSMSGCIYRYGDFEFDFRDAMKLCERAGHPFPENNGSTRNNRAFLQQFATREGAEAALKRVRDAVNGGAK